MMGLELKWWFLIGSVALISFILLNGSASIKKPFVLAWYGILYSVVGGLVLFLFNLVGQSVHLNIPINMVTAFITGALGLPGVLYLVVVKLVLIA